MLEVTEVDNTTQLVESINRLHAALNSQKQLSFMDKYGDHFAKGLMSVCAGGIVAISLFLIGQRETLSLLQKDVEYLKISSNSPRLTVGDIEPMRQMILRHDVILDQRSSFMAQTNDRLTAMETTMKALDRARRN